MTTEREPGTRIVLSWLREDAHENAERVLLRALDEVDTTPQRRSWWPAWRFAHMKTLPADTRQAITVGVRAVTRKNPAIGWPVRRGLPRIDLRRLSLGLGSAAVVVLAAVVSLNALPGLTGLGGLSPDDPRSPFVGLWLSTTDDDGGTQTMRVRVAGDGLDIVMRDDIATVCAMTPSTMTATGRIDNEIYLVMPTPAYTCDDGTEPVVQGGTPLSELLRDFTLVRDAQADTLSDGVGGVWWREGATRPAPTPRQSAPAISDSMWPQSTLEEVNQAQELADAGDPAYTWQVDSQLFTDDTWIGEEPGQIEIVDRFLRDELGWDAYVLNFWEGMGRNGVYDVNYDQRYLRCAPLGTNPLYPPGPEPEWGELCAPTLDDLRYESVSIDLAQLVRQESDGIWVVNGWRLTAPFAQADPVAVEAQATQRLEEFLAARIAGTGAEGHVQVDPDVDVPLLYAPTSGAPYERYELERVEGPQWPFGRMAFSARLFADGDATVVEQEIRREQDGGLVLNANSTTENGQPVVVSYTSSDGEVSASVPSTWDLYWPGVGSQANVWFGILWRDSEPYYESGESIGFVDPVAYDSWCAANGGSPLLSAPADAAAIAQKVIADPNFETTAPVAARVGGVEAVSIDVTLAPGGSACGIGMIEISRWIHTVESQPGSRLRLYLVDLPEGMSVETLAISVVAPEERFQEFIEETAPIIESIEFHVP